MTDIEIRRAVSADVPAVVAMLADDELGAARESLDDLAPYHEAFARLNEAPGQLLMVAVRDGAVVGTLQLTIIPGLSRRGATRALIEGVRVAGAARGAGIGERLVSWAVAEARRRGCLLVQLTSDKSRSRAHRFYERLGFTASHVGFKLQLGPGR